MVETLIVAFTTFFATIGPIDVAAVFAALASDDSPQERRRTALRGTLISTAILLLFAFAGQLLLNRLGISLAAFRTGGGVLLLLMGIDMVFARSSGGTTTTDEEREEAETKQDISVFPLATPLIAGPGAMGAAILLMADTRGDTFLMIAVVLALLAVLLITLIALLLATQVQRLFGVTGLQVIARIFGVLLVALAVQFIFDGILESGIVN
ncbi:MAG: MarC family protein [Chloroflexota bacterium]